MRAEPPPVEVRIDELVLLGPAPADPERLGPAVEAALAARLATAPPQGPARRGPAVVAASCELRDAGIDALAEAVAEGLDAAIRGRLGGPA